MRRIRVQKQVRHRHVRHETVLSLDPRDPDVVRAKRLERSTRDTQNARAA